MAEVHYAFFAILQKSYYIYLIICLIIKLLAYIIYITTYLFFRYLRLFTTFGKYEISFVRF
jgi:hypothetical protein